ncbi:MAG: hypothetical protein EBS29_09100 [Chloroflexia bacterium]|nr:hypothetical protein [Chloroflexia bacterium]
MKQLWRIGLVALGLVFLVACGGGSVVIPDPISKVDAKEISNATVKGIVTEWQSTARKGLETGAVKPETIVETIYQSSADLTAVADYYNKALGTGGWTYKTRTPGLQDGFFLSAYEHGNKSLVIGAIDLSKFAGAGTYVYVLSGDK